jgi:hypothetical protein
MILDEQREPCESICPICLASSYTCINAYCKGRDCMWWIKEKHDCAIKVIAKGVSNNDL